MRISITDDDPDDIVTLERMLRRYAQENHLEIELSAFRDGPSLLERSVPGRFDVSFLDICMEGPDGLSVAEQIHAADPEALIVFTTTSAEYAVDSYRVRAYDYLLKPIPYQRLAATMDLCGHALRRAERYIQVKNGRELVSLPVADIVYTDYSNHYIYFYTKSDPGGSLRTGSSFAEFAPTLLAFPQFLNCCRNTLINMDEVARMESDSFLLTSGITIPMYRNKKTELRQAYASYMFRKLNGG